MPEMPSASLLTLQDKRPDFFNKLQGDGEENLMQYVHLVWILIPTLRRNILPISCPGYPYIQRMPKATPRFHKNTCYLHTFLSLPMLSTVSTNSKPEPQEISLKLSEFSQVLRSMAHLLFCTGPAGGANSPSRTSQGRNSRSQYFEIPQQPFLTCPRSAPSNLSASCTAIGCGQIA